MTFISQGDYVVINRKFSAIAYNDKGHTFVFFLRNPNWCGIEGVARKALDKLVETDKLYKAHGPWAFRNVQPAE